MARSTRKSKGIFRRVYSPIQHLIEATRNVSRSAFRRGGKIVDNTLGFGGNVGNALTKHANMAVRNVTGRRRERRERRSRRERRERRETRRGRRNERRN